MADEADEYGIVVMTNDTFQKTTLYDKGRFQKIIDNQNKVKNKGWSPHSINHREALPNHYFFDLYVTNFRTILEAKLYISLNRLQVIEKSIEVLGGVNVDTSYGRHKLASLQGEVQKTNEWIQEKYHEYPEYLL